MTNILIQITLLALYGINFFTLYSEQQKFFIFGVHCADFALRETQHLPLQNRAHPPGGITVELLQNNRRIQYMA